MEKIQERTMFILNEIVVRADIHCVTVTTLVQKFAIVAKLCFFNLLYYREVRYPISNKGNPSFINLDIQRRFTEKVYRAPVGIKKIKFSIWVSDYQIFGLSDLRTIGSSNYLTFGLSDMRTIGPSPFVLRP